MGWSEYVLATFVLRLLGRVFAHFPFRRNRVVLATARTPVLEGNLAFLHRVIRDSVPRAEVRLLLEPYSYGLIGKLAYLARLIRGTFYLQTSGLVIVDNEDRQLRGHFHGGRDHEPTIPQTPTGRPG